MNNWKALVLALLWWPFAALAAEPMEEEIPAEVDFYVFNTDPGSGLTETEIVWPDWLIEEEDTLLPLVFEGDSGTNELAVYFNDNLLETYNGLDSLQDALGWLAVDTAAYLGQQATLKVVLTNTGSDASLIATPVETRNTDAIEKAVAALHPAPDKDDGGGVMALLWLGVLIWRRRRIG